MDLNRNWYPYLIPLFSKYSFDQRTIIVQILLTALKLLLYKNIYAIFVAGYATTLLRYEIKIYVYRTFDACLLSCTILYYCIIMDTFKGNGIFLLNIDLFECYTFCERNSFGLTRHVTAHSQHQWKGNTIWSRSALAQVAAWCLQCWLINNGLWHSPDSNFTRNTHERHTLTCVRRLPFQNYYHIFLEAMG